MGRVILLIAKKVNGKGFPLGKANVVGVQEDAIRVVSPRNANKKTYVVEEIDGSEVTYQVYEKALQIEAARNPVSTDTIIKQQIALAISTAGTTQGAGTVLTKYFNELTVVAGGATSCVLPAATAGKACVVVNNDAADAALIFPASGEFIDTGLVNVNTTLSAGTRKHFYCDVAGTWLTAIDRTL